MNKKKSVTSTFIKLILVIGLIVLSYTLYSKNKQLNSKLESIKIFSYQNGNVKVINAKQINNTDTLLTLPTLTAFHNYKSPFNDGKTYQQLMAKYIRNKRQDLFGARRRTGVFRRTHEGIDLFVKENTPLYPLADFGVVTEVSDDPHYMVSVTGIKDGVKKKIKVDYGKLVRIRYPEGIESVYAHLSEIYVKPGQVVTANDMVGKTGLTGNLKASGKPSHLHFELRDSSNKAFNPLDRLYFDKADYKHFLKLIKVKEEKK